VTLALEAPRLVDIEGERCRRSLRRFITDAWHVPEPANPFVPGWHLDCITDHLEAVTRGEIRNLLINMPPRHMKSLAVSVFWPCWEWTSTPERRWLFTSYAEKLAIRDSVKCRRLIESPWYQERWGRLAAWREVFDLTDDQNQKVRFENDKTGYRIASSVGGANTGEGGDRIVVDDPHSIEEAESEVVREGVLSWWDEVMSTRGNDPKTVARVIVMQRAHEDDLSGHVLAQGGYHHLCLPARYERRAMVAGLRVEHAAIGPHDDCAIGSVDPRTDEGALLWPERFDAASLDDLESRLGTYGVSGQMQQRPVPRAGALFRSDWFRHLPPGFAEMRPSLTTVQFWDLAFSEKAAADHTAAVTLDVDAGRTGFYITHVLRERVAEANLLDVMARHVALTRPAVVGVEEGAYKQAATRDLVRLLQEKLAREHALAVPVFAVKVTGDKTFRAQLPAARAALGQVYADRTAPWWSGFEAELLRFPRGQHDDQADALAGAVQLAIEKGGSVPLDGGSYSFPGGKTTPRASILKEMRVARRQRAPVAGATPVVASATSVVAPSPVIGRRL
jgi:predicted phage terminase large subunit-like protein